MGLLWHKEDGIMAETTAHRQRAHARGPPKACEAVT